MQSEEEGLETRNIKGASQAIDGDDGEKGSENGFGDAPREFVFQEWTYGFGEYRQSLDQNELKKYAEGKNFYELTFKNKGGLVTPILVEWTYADGTTELEKIPAEICKMNEKEVKKVFLKDKEVTRIVIDPDQLTADTNTGDNVFPREEESDRFEKFKSGK